MTRMRLTAITAATAAMALFLTACGTTEEQPASRRRRPRGVQRSGDVHRRPRQDGHAGQAGHQGRRAGVGRGRDPGQPRRHAGRRRRREGLRHLGHRRDARPRTSRTSAPAASPASTRSSRSNPTSWSWRPSATRRWSRSWRSSCRCWSPRAATRAATSTGCGTTSTMIATAVGKDAEGDKLLADFDAALAAGKEKIAAAGAAGKYFAMADGWKEGSTVNIRMFGQGALVSQVGDRAGAEERVDGEVDRQWGLGQTDVEGLTALKEDDLRFFYNASDGTDVFSRGPGAATPSGSRCRSSRQKQGAQAARRHLDLRRAEVLHAVHRRARRDVRGLMPATTTVPGPARTAPARAVAARAPAADHRRVRRRGAGGPGRRAVHLTQGTSSIGALDLLRLAFGGDDAETARVLVASRLPRLLAAVTVGVALGVAGAALQSFARNPLASPDTLAVNAGAYLAVVGVAAFGVSLPVLPAGGARVPRRAGRRRPGPRAVGRRRGRADPADPRRHRRRAGARLADHRAPAAVRAEHGRPVRLGQRLAGAGRPATASPSSRRSSRSASAAPGRLGAPAGHPRPRRRHRHGARRPRADGPGSAVMLLAVLLSAAAVTLAGPIGFVGLCAPVIVRLLARRRARHAAGTARCCRCPGIAGVVVAARLRRAAARRAGRPGGRRHPGRRGHHAVRRGRAGVAGPPPPRRRPDPAAADRAAGRPAYPRVLRRRRRHGRGRRRGRGRVGHARRRHLAAARRRRQLGPGHAPGRRTPSCSTSAGRGSPPRCWPARRWRSPAPPCRRCAATRSPSRACSASPAGAGVGAVALITMAPLAGIWAMSAVAGGGALLAFALVYGLSWRGGGLSSDRLVLIGIGAAGRPVRGHHVHHHGHRPVEHRQGADLAVRLDVRPDAGAGGAGGGRARRPDAGADPGPARPGPAGARRGHAAGAGRPAGAHPAGRPGRRGAAHLDRGLRRRRGRLRRPGRAARRPGAGRRPALPRAAGGRAARRAAGQRRRHARPHGHRAGADPRRPGHRADRHPVLRLAAVAVPDRTRRAPS